MSLEADQPVVVILEKLGWSRKVERMLANVSYFSAWPGQTMSISSQRADNRGLPQ